MIAQNYLVYPEANAEMIQALIDVELNESMNQRDEDLMVERRRMDDLYKSDPLVNYVVRAFHAIIMRIGLSPEVNDSLLALIDTMTNLYKNLDL